LANQVGCGLLTDALNSLDVVAGITFERLVIDHVLRAEAVALGSALLVVIDGVALVGPEHEEVDVRADELDEVRIERCDVGFEALGRHPLRDGAGDIVGFEARHLEYRYAEGVEHLTDALHLDQEV
jgi:hypothetical protein